MTFWTGATILASALPVRLPRGVIISVAAAPMIAVFILGGPLAGALVALIGTTDSREVRGKVPWYGTAFNHASAVNSAVAGASFLTFCAPLSRQRRRLLPLVCSSQRFWLASSSFGQRGPRDPAVSARTEVAIQTVLAQDIGAVATSLVGLAPLAWLMTLTFQLGDGVGWWATPLFVVPFLTTRLAFARYVETRELFEQTIEALSKAVDARDPYTRNHSSRVSHIAEAMCREMRLSEGEIEKIKWAGLLHDIGKIGIRDNVLLKEGPLDKNERVLMNQHPTIGAEIVAPASQLAPQAPLIKSHHEWFNGSGYPDGVEALDIPLGARILTIADAYEAMTSSRPYRKTPLTHEEAVDQLVKFTGIQFDPDIVPILIGLDRSILDRPPDRPDELPTMLHPPILKDVPREQAELPRPALASSDDVS